MPRKPTDVSEAMQDIMVQSYTAGTTVADLAQQLGYSPLIVRRVLRAHSVPVRPYPQLRGDRNAKIIKARKKGKTLDQIAKKFGMSRQRVHVITTRGY